MGRNYTDHINELKNEKPQHPVLFLKPDTAIIQKEQPIGIDYVDVIVITNTITELHLNVAIRKIEQLDTVQGDATVIRLERLDQV